MDMGAKITAFFEHIKTFTAQYLTIASIVTVVWGGFRVYDNWKDNNLILTNKVERVLTLDSLLLIRQKEMSTEIQSIKSTTEDNRTELKSLKNSYIKYISNDKGLTKTDFLQYMEGLSVDVKKNSSPLTNN